MARLFTTLFLLIILTTSFGQSNSLFADSIRIKYKIPELGFAVVSSDSIFELQVLGFKRRFSGSKANTTDKFRIGSNTKTITSYIATVLVKQGKINWETKFFDLYPELKTKSNPAYYDLTLQEFLTFRANTIKWSYGNKTPTKKEIKGNSQQQRYSFIGWILQQDPVAEKQDLYWSNPSYVAAALMLEKATGKNYETLVAEFGQELKIQFEFGQPNLKDKNQPWGHDEKLKPEKPALNYKLNWLSSAGNINVSLPDYSKFIQLQLQGLLGKSEILTASEFEYMHYGLPEFSFGWKWFIDEKTKLRYSFHEGNPGTFLTKTFICKEQNKAFILFANVQSPEADTGLNILLDELKKQYGR
ncbi:MAG: serine hydrolase [Chitinophagaceae bacterium]|nr:serine hydrolase [Chitinophagaceae bacterium]